MGDHIRVVPSARRLVQSLRDLGYGLPDAVADLVDSLRPGATGVLRTKVAGRTGLTPYVRLGDLFAFVCAAVAAVSLILGYVRQLPALPVRPAPSFSAAK